MVVATFDKKFTTARAFGLYQYDYGQVLRIQGLTLPIAVEIHFAYQPSGGQSVTRVGMTKDGVTDVVIPDSMLENNDIKDNYKIYVFVYITDETSGQTEYCIEMPVTARPKPEAFDRPEDSEIFREAIKAVSESSERAEQAGNAAKEYASQSELNAQKTAKDREDIEVLVESVSGISEQVETVKRYSEEAKKASSAALLSEQASEEIKTSVMQAKEQVDLSEQKVTLISEEVTQSKNLVEQAKNNVQQISEKVLENKTLIDEKVQVFTTTVETATTNIQSLKNQTVNEIAVEGQKQIQAVQNKGTEILDSIQLDLISHIATIEEAKQYLQNEVI